MICCIGKKKVSTNTASAEEWSTWRLNININVTDNQMENTISDTIVAEQDCEVMM